MTVVPMAIFLFYLTKRINRFTAQAIPLSLHHHLFVCFFLANYLQASFLLCFFLFGDHWLRHNLLKYKLIHLVSTRLVTFSLQQQQQKYKMKN